MFSLGERQQSQQSHDFEERPYCLLKVFTGSYKMSNEEDIPSPFMIVLLDNEVNLEKDQIKKLRKILK